MLMLSFIFIYCLTWIIKELIHYPDSFWKLLYTVYSVPSVHKNSKYALNKNYEHI